MKEQWNVQCVQQGSTVQLKELQNVKHVQQGSTVQLKELQYVKHVQQGSSLQKAVTHALIVQEGLIVPQGPVSAFPADLESIGNAIMS